MFLLVWRRTKPCSFLAGFSLAMRALIRGLLIRARHSVIGALRVEMTGRMTLECVRFVCKGKENLFTNTILATQPLQASALTRMSLYRLTASHCTNEPVQADCTRPSLGCRRIFFLDTSTGSQVPLVGKLAKFRILCVQMLECRLQAGVCLQPLQVFVHVQAHVVLVNQDRHLGGPASSASALGPGLVPVHLARGEGWRV